jgi:hypothetical protein
VIDVSVTTADDMHIVLTDSIGGIVVLTLDEVRGLRADLADALAEAAQLERMYSA